MGEPLVSQGVVQRELTRVGELGVFRSPQDGRLGAQVIPQRGFSRRGRVQGAGQASAFCIQVCGVKGLE